MWIKACSLGITEKIAPMVIPRIETLGISYTQKLGISFDAYPLL